MRVNKTTCTVIIVTYNGEQWISKCLDHLVPNLKWIEEVIIVDNNSSDKTTLIAQSHKILSSLIQLDSNLGFGRANNVGLEKALVNNSNFILLLNQDAYLKNNCLEKLIEAALNNVGYGIISPIHYQNNRELLDYNFKEYLFKNNPSVIIDDAVNQAVLKEIYTADFVNAAIWLLPKNVIKSIGGFDPIFYHYGEDRNFAERVKFSKLKIGIVPKAKAVHDRQQTDGEFKKLNKSRFLFMCQRTNQKKPITILKGCINIFGVNFLTFKENKTLSYIFFKSVKDIFWAIANTPRFDQARANYSKNIDNLYLNSYENLKT